MSRMRTRIAALAAAAVSAAVLAPMPVTSAVADDDLGSRFTLAVMPDTQFYSR